MTPLMGLARPLHAPLLPPARPGTGGGGLAGHAERVARLGHLGGLPGLSLRQRQQLPLPLWTGGTEFPC